ncbi:MAG: RdgB/HAM1 family non-canonical purine NTP pyrophosphatase [Acidobacteria bacterium]|nr:MAG: RdgB/HAM1 family non-canonical purine NTP pyrophosphatase [Acidobacteriota bacterium]
MLPRKSRLLLATRNLGKCREIQAVLADLEIQILTLLDFPTLPEVEETGATFAENARLKARYCWEQTSLPSLADDSGLAVDALGGRPGVQSARFAPSDSERVVRLLALMRPFEPPDQRKARFLCALCLVSDSGALEVEASVEGRIAANPAGEAGFGYDPIFYYPPLGRTFGQLTNAEKNAVSHRFLALQKLRAKLVE